ncbi:hypothetical protein KFU94_64060 [Chloroflexi bacterium TSY]|nr:hypothetical protein [Chloroflexi bacterium TSY]
MDIQTDRNGQVIAVTGGDVITAIDGQPIRSFEDVLSYAERFTIVGQQVTITALWDGQTLHIPVIVDARPDMSRMTTR